MTDEGIGQERDKVKLRLELPELKFICIYRLICSINDIHHVPLVAARHSKMARNCIVSQKVPLAIVRRHQSLAFNKSSQSDYFSFKSLFKG